MPLFGVARLSFLSASDSSDREHNGENRQHDGRHGFRMARHPCGGASQRAEHPLTTGCPEYRGYRDAETRDGGEDLDSEGLLGRRLSRFEYDRGTRCYWCDVLRIGRAE